MNNPALKTYADFFPILEQFCTRGICFWMCDIEKFVCKVQGEDSPGDSFEIGDPILSGGSARRAINDRTAVFVELPKEVYGYEANVIAVPLMDTDNRDEVVGVIGMSRSRAVQHEVNKSARDLNIFIENLAQASEDVATGAEEILLHSRKNLDMNNQIQTINVHIEKLLQDIRDVSQTIKLLGINITIEAARAGENGRGFQVIAKEIGNLSNNAANISVDIGKTLETIKWAVQEMTISNNKAIEATEREAAASQELSASTREVSLISRQLLEIAKEL